VRVVGISCLLGYGAVRAPWDAGCSTAIAESMQKRSLANRQPLGSDFPAGSMLLTRSDGRSTSSHSDRSVIEFQSLVWSRGLTAGTEALRFGETRSMPCARPAGR